MKKEEKNNEETIIPEQKFETLYNPLSDGKMEGAIYYGGVPVLTFSEDDWINKHFYDNISKKLNS